ncbi:GL10832 [Drosophila persimilis]|uniref:GL10832 n=1 Tax=Drosophila persimilis TaxID=7234 RepID=B4GDL7_DROPE|nr:GL10832 [Drosophila persimilis]
MDATSGPGAFDDEPPPEPRDGWLLVRIHVPELNVYKCLQFPSERLVWDVKQQVLASLPKYPFPRTGRATIRKRRSGIGLAEPPMEAAGAALLAAAGGWSWVVQ